MQFEVRPVRAAVCFPAESSCLAPGVELEVLDIVRAWPLGNNPG